MRIIWLLVNFLRDAHGSLAQALHLFLAPTSNCSSNWFKKRLERYYIVYQWCVYNYRLI